MENPLPLLKSSTSTIAQRNMKTSERFILGGFVTLVAFLVLAASVGPVPQYTPYSIRMLTNSTATSMQSYLSVPSSTNVVLLNTTNYVIERILYSGPPNTLTNVTGLYGSSQLVHTVSIPAGALGTNGVLLLNYDVQLAGTIGTAGTTRGFTLHHNLTNDLCRIQFFAGSTASTNQVTAGGVLFLKNVLTETNNVSSLNQVEGGAFQSGGRSAWAAGQTTQNSMPNVDTSSAWTLYIYGNSGGASETNIYKRLVITVIKR